MEVSRISTFIKNGRDYIRIFGYNQNGQPVRKLTPVQNYIFVEEKDLKKLGKSVQIQTEQYISYDNHISSKKLRKVILKGARTSFVPKPLQKISYQSDISLETKYMLDEGLEFSRKRHIAFYDIETYYDFENDPESNSVDRADSPITSIAFYSNLLKTYFILAWHPSIETGDDPFIIEQKGDKQFYYCDSEATVIQTFCELIKVLNVDIITGWFSHGYDLPYILKRCEKLFGSMNLISPLENVWMGNRKFGDEYKIRISGLDTVDMMQGVGKFNYKLQNNKLDTAAEMILGQKHKKLKTATWRDWEDNFQGFLKYVARDVEILQLIDKKLKVFEFLVQQQILSGITSLTDIMSVTRLIDALLIKRYWGVYVFPNNLRAERVNFMGAITITPKQPGVHQNVAVMDYASLYPTTIMSYNISPETFLFSKTQLGEEEFEKQLKFLQKNDIKYIDTGQSDQMFGKRYIFLSHDQHAGVLPEISRELYLMRKDLKREAKKGKTADQRLVADKKQYAIKIILNSIYGATGFAQFRLFVPECADAITFWGRTAVKFAMNNLDPYGKVLYGDTDSVGQNSNIRYRIKQK